MSLNGSLRIVLLAALLAPVGAAARQAVGGHDDRGGREGRGGHDRGGHTSKPPRTIPEFDPSAAGAIATLAAGGGLLLARRRRSPA